MNGPRRHQGFTLIEMVLAIVVIGIGLAGVMMAFNATVQRSADPVVAKQLLSVAEEMMEEIQLKPYAASAPTRSPGCTRNYFNDITDYNGYVVSQVCDIDGTAIAALSGYAVSVSVTGAALGSIPAANAMRISVTVSRGTDSLTLVGWRTNYAGS